MSDDEVDRLRGDDELDAAEQLADADAGHGEDEPRRVAEPPHDDASTSAPVTTPTATPMGRATKKYGTPCSLCSPMAMTPAKLPIDP